MTEFNDRLRDHLDAWFLNHKEISKRNYEWLKSIIQDVNK